MLFAARAPELGIAAHREDVVPHGVVAPVVLVERAVRGAQDEVVLGEDARGAFIELDAPRDGAPGEGVGVVVAF